MKLNNPFLITGYHSSEYFCDREQETETIISALHNGRNLTLIAPRRMGKTGLIQNAFFKLNKEQPEIVTLYMDIYSTQNLSDFVRLFASTVLGQLDNTSTKAISKIGQFFKSCRPSFSFDELTGAPKVTIDILPDQEEASLKEIFEYLKSSPKRCYIAIDEFQQITEYPEKGIEALIRSYIQFIPNVNFIFAGSRQHVMQEMFLSAKRPFYQSTQTLSIDSIDKKLYYEFASKFFDAKNNTLDEALFSYIYDEFAGHTWYIQVLLNRLYGYNKSVDMKLVKYAINEVITEFVYMYQNLMAAYSANSIKLIKAIAKEHLVKEINSGEFIAQYKLKAASSVNTTLKKLVHNELVYKSDDGYIVYDRFMAIWLREQLF